MKNIRFLLYPALICLINSVSLPSLSAPGNWFQLRNRRSGLCLDVPEGRSENNLEIQQYVCRSSDDSWVEAQLWQLTKVGNYVQLRNRRSGLCLDVPGGRSENNLEIQQYVCRLPDDSWVEAQLWQLTKVGNYVQLRNRRSGLCLDVPGGRSENNLEIQQYVCRLPDDSWVEAQLWQVTQVR